MPLLNQKGAIHLFFLLILLSGIVAGVYLVAFGDPLKLFSKAAPILPSTPETSFALELEKNAESPFPDEPAPDSISLKTKFRVDIYARSDIDVANLFVAKLKFDPSIINVDNIIRRDNSLVKQWVETNFDNDNGIVSLAGTVSSSGLKTDVGNNYLLGSVVFNTKIEGNASITFVDTSAIFSNSSNMNLLALDKSKGLTVSVKNAPVITSIDQQQVICQGYTITNAIMVKDSTGLNYYIAEPNQSVGLKLNTNIPASQVSWKATSGSITTGEDYGKWAVPDAEGEYQISAILNEPYSANCPSVKIMVKKPEQAVSTTTIYRDPKDGIIKRDGDINSDSKWDYADLSAFLTQSGVNKGKDDVVSEADLDANKVINTLDYAKELSILKDKGVLKGQVSNPTNTTIPSTTSSDPNRVTLLAPTDLSSALAEDLTRRSITGVPADSLIQSVKGIEVGLDLTKGIWDNLQNKVIGGKDTNFFILTLKNNTASAHTVKVVIQMFKQGTTALYKDGVNQGVMAFSTSGGDRQDNSVALPSGGQHSSNLVQALPAGKYDVYLNTVYVDNMSNSTMGQEPGLHKPFATIEIK